MRGDEGEGLGGGAQGKGVGVRQESIKRVACDARVFRGHHAVRVSYGSLTVRIECGSCSKVFQDVEQEGLGKELPGERC